MRLCFVQGVVEYSLALFFNKLVSYTFLYWLPLYVKATRKWSGFQVAFAGFLS